MAALARASRFSVARVGSKLSKGVDMSGLKRRDVLKAAVAATAGIGFPAIIRAQQKEVVMLGLWDQTIPWR